MHWHKQDHSVTLLKSLLSPPPPQAVALGRQRSDVPLHGRGHVHDALHKERGNESCRRPRQDPLKSFPFDVVPAPGLRYTNQSFRMQGTQKRVNVNCVNMKKHLTEYLSFKKNSYYKLL